MAGLKGLIYSTRPGSPARPLRGLFGIKYSVAGNLSVKVVNYKGRGISDVKITTVQGKSFFTDSQGNAFILVEGTNVQLTLSKYKVKKAYAVPNGVAQVQFVFGRQVLR